MKLAPKVAARRGLAALAAAAVTCSMLVPAALAGQPVTQPLNPAPPSFESCMTAGNGIICSGARVESFGYDAFTCGSGASTFDPFTQGLDYQHAIRYYDANGDLLKRVIYDHTVGALSNPLTGTAIPYDQHDTITDMLAVPGDFGSATETNTGQGNFTVPGMGAVMLNAGRIVTGPDGTLEFTAGPQGFWDFFVNGNTAAVDGLCAALGS